MWRGDTLFLLENLVVKEFRIRYRNMSLGVLWSLLNPLVMMGALTFVFTIVFPNPDIKNFPVFALCGLVPYNFFVLAGNNGTTSIVDQASLVKRVPLPREIVPIASVLSNCIHLGIQILLLLACVVAFSGRPSVYWLWLPAVWGFEIVFVCGWVLLTSTMNVYIRDTRYLVESLNLILFWLVPIFYELDKVPARYAQVFQYNPIAALVLCMRRILLSSAAPPLPTLLKLATVSLSMFFVGLVVFRKGKHAFYEYL